MSFHLFARDCCAAAPDERVQHQVAFFRVEVEDVPEEAYRFLCWVWLPILQGSVVEYGDAPYSADLSFPFFAPDDDDFVVVDGFAVWFVPDVSCDFVPAARWLWYVVGVPEERDLALRFLAGVVQRGVPVHNLVLEEFHPVRVRRVCQDEVDALVGYLCHGGDRVHFVYGVLLQHCFSSCSIGSPYRST